MSLAIPYKTSTSLLQFVICVILNDFFFSIKNIVPLTLDLAKLRKIIFPFLHLIFFQFFQFNS